MITKPLVIAFVLCLATTSVVMAQDWQAAEMVDEIRHTSDSIWIPDRRTMPPQQEQAQTTSESVVMVKPAAAQVSSITFLLP